MHTKYLPAPCGAESEEEDFGLFLIAADLEFGRSAAYVLVKGRSSSDCSATLRSPAGAPPLTADIYGRRLFFLTGRRQKEKMLFSFSYKALLSLRLQTLPL